MIVDLRATTNKASAPGICQPPHVVDISFDFVQLEIGVPSEGGSRVHCFEVEAMNLEDNCTTQHKLTRYPGDTSERFLGRLSGLTPDCAYLFRCKAEGAVGDSVTFSEWVRAPL